MLILAIASSNAGVGVKMAESEILIILERRNIDKRTLFTGGMHLFAITLESSVHEGTMSDTMETGSLQTTQPTEIREV